MENQIKQTDNKIKSDEIIENIMKSLNGINYWEAEYLLRQCLEVHLKLYALVKSE